MAYSSIIALTNRFHVAVHLFSNRSQMTSKCKNKKRCTGGVAECVTDVLTTFWRLLWSITESDARQHGIYLCCLESYRSWKNNLGKLVVTVNLEAIWFTFWRKGDILWETHFSCDTVDRGLWLAILSSLLSPETDRNIRIGKQGYVFYFTNSQNFPPF